MAESTYKSILWQAQEKVCEILNQDPVLSGKVSFFPENSKDIDFEIKNALGKQAIVGIVMTPQATYQGTASGEELAWDLRDFTVQIVENPVVNRGNPISSDVITAQDAASRVSDVLSYPQSELFGIYCPTTIETGEDSNLIVAQAKFNCLIRAQRTPQPKKYRVSWYITNGTADRQPGLIDEGTQVTFTTVDNDYVLGRVEINGVDPGDADYGSDSYIWTVDEDAFIKVTFELSE